MRIGIFGGSFDPVHFGHLWIAEAAIETLGLNEIRWIPAAQQPLKPSGPVASAEDRVMMLRLAVSGCPQHVVDDREIQRGDVSYTVDTVSELKTEYPDADILMVIGSDSLATMRQWHHPERLMENVIPAVVQRGGDAEIDFSVLEGLASAERIDEIRQHVITMPLIELSSTELRSRVGAGQGIRFRTPHAVEALIRANGVYR